MLCASFCTSHYLLPCPAPLAILVFPDIHVLHFPSYVPSSLAVSFATVFMLCVLVKLFCAVSAFLQPRLICRLSPRQLKARTMSLFILMPRQSARYILNLKWQPLFGNHPGPLKNDLNQTNPDQPSPGEWEGKPNRAAHQQASRG